MIRHTLFGMLFVAMIAAAASADQETGKPTEKEGAAKLVPLNKKGTVLLDAKGKRVVLKSKVVLREGTLEMLICPVRTKEHEAILAVDAKAYVVHTALLAIGAKTGKPAKFDPKFKPPTGQQIDIFFTWKDRTGKLRRANAKNWVRTVVRRYYTYKMKKLPADLKLPEKGKSELKFDDKVGELFWFGHMTKQQRDELLKRSKDAEYQKAINQFYRGSQPRQLESKWVFAGSGFDKNGAGEPVYLAELGSMICLANFPSAMIDVAQESSAQNGLALFEAHTERIPPLGTEVTVELIPVFKKKK